MKYKPWTFISKEFVLIVSFIIILSLLPIFCGTYIMIVLTLIFLTAYLGHAWNIIGGYTGQHSFGHAMFFGIGAYTSTLLYINLGVTPWIGMFAGGFLASLVALFVGYLTFRYRIKGVFFVIVTIAFAEIVRLIVNHVDYFGRDTGILIPFKGNAPLQFSFQEREPYYYIALFMMTILWIFVAIIDRSRLGYYLKAIQQNETEADTMGLDVMKYKLFSFCLSAFVTAIGGTFYAQYLLYVNPTSTMGIMVSVEVIIVTMVGGTGTVLGPIVGSFLLSPISEILRTLLKESYFSGVHLMCYSLILMLIALFLVKGL